MTKEELKTLNDRHKKAQTLGRYIDDTRSIIDGIRRRQAKGTSDYQVSLRRKVDGYNSSVYVTIPESVVAAMIPGLKAALDKMRQEFKAL